MLIAYIAVLFHYCVGGSYTVVTDGNKITDRKN